MAPACRRGDSCGVVGEGGGMSEGGTEREWGNGALRRATYSRKANWRLTSAAVSDLFVYR